MFCDCIREFFYGWKLSEILALFAPMVEFGAFVFLNKFYEINKPISNANLSSAVAKMFRRYNPNNQEYAKE